MEALKASVEEHRSRGRARPTGKSGSKRTAKKTTTKRSTGRRKSA
jgi:hypothetical protein